MNLIPILLHFFSTKKLILLPALLLIIPNVCATDTPETPFERDSFVIGRVSDNPKKHFKTLKPLADYLAVNLHQYGIKKGNVIFAKDNQQMRQYIEQGKVDLVSETAFSATILSQTDHAEVILRRWKKGVANYCTLIFARKDSGINSLADLVDKTIAFQDPGSTSAFFIPSATLIRNGFELYPLKSIRDKPPKGKIGYVFANSEINISAWVNNNIVDAGAFSNLNWENPKDMPDTFKQSLSVFYESEHFPRGVELIRSNIDPRIKQAVTNLLLNADQTPKGQEALLAYQETKKYEPLSEQDSIMVITKALQEIVSNQL